MSFCEAFEEGNISSMETYYIPSELDNYYIDTALEQGKKKQVDFFLNKGVRPSLFACQMARVNGFDGLANHVESFTKFRNQVSLSSFYKTYDPKEKKIVWKPIIPDCHRY